MSDVYERDLDLNLLRVFVVVADSGTVTAAAGRLYLTQPAVSAALRRLTDALGAPLFVREGRGLALTGRGERLLAEVRPHLAALAQAAAAAPAFDPATSDRVVRLGLADACEVWLLPELLARFERDAPGLRVVSLPVQFRTVGEALATRAVDLAITVADDLPASVLRRDLFCGGYVCLYDPTRVDLAPGAAIDEATYFAHEHIIVSYNGDLRGVVEDILGKQRRIRCSVGTFHAVGPCVEGSTLLASVPESVAGPILKRHPRLAACPLPFVSGDAAVELLWPRATDDDPCLRWLRELIVELAADIAPAAR
ncbi:MAG: LysR family transcriptional regulator [Myxococcales bacterium]|nr:LysR family transcriptional regulator [Myxococcales bacterium]MCB9736931.1 LysR family transcriptional regulator [Deltaproteobacteria bacterium]